MFSKGALSMLQDSSGSSLKPYKYTLHYLLGAKCMTCQWEKAWYLIGFVDSLQSEPRLQWWGNSSLVRKSFKHSWDYISPEASHVVFKWLKFICTSLHHKFSIFITIFCDTVNLKNRQFFCYSWDHKGVKFNRALNYCVYIVTKAQFTVESIWYTKDMSFCILLIMHHL